MSDLNGSERRKLEKLFGMDSGYVLNFSDRTFGEFFDEHQININAIHYRSNGTSKANRLRTHWSLDSNYIVGKTIEGLIKYAADEHCFNEINPLLTKDCLDISHRLTNSQLVAELDALTTANVDQDFDVIIEQVRQAIELNQPGSALDRLHTFVIKYIRQNCVRHGITLDRDKPLHSLFGEYVKILRKDGHIESDMTERILKSSISVLEAFNDVRNHKSLAHDNPILNHEESLLIFNYIAASIRYIKALESKISHNLIEQPTKPNHEDSFF